VDLDPLIRTSVQRIRMRIREAQRHTGYMGGSGTPVKNH
jgi:hypothetical protein